MAGRERSPRRVEAPRLLADLAPMPLELDDDVVVELVQVEGGTVPAALSGVSLRACRLVGVVFTAATLVKAELLDVVLVDCELSGSTWEQARFERVRFERCRMSGFTAPGLDARDVAFVDCKADGAWLRMAKVRHCSFDGCDLTGSDFYEAAVSSSRLVRCTLDDAELSGAAFDDVALHGTTLTAVRGAASLRNVVIGPDQIVDLALPVFASLGIRIEEEPDAPADEGDRAS